MNRSPKMLPVLVVLLALFSVNATGAVTDDDDDLSEENARVARLQVLEGEARIRRDESEDWERAVENLPLVEGDEIVTDPDSRLEIQFDRDKYLRLAGSSHLKIINLQEKGIVVSLSQGSLDLLVLKFDVDEEFLEIDAPQTTVALQKEGKYRIDAGDETDREVRVVVSEWGAARVYSSDAGFTVKNGQTARLALEGPYAGQWDTSRSRGRDDDFDKWTAARDSFIDKRLRKASGTRYYDQDIYGVADLYDYGEWIYAAGYGYVWRPYTSSVTRYANWSPYRYGHWRWLPYYGWVWVNDEPWGWATYHYGRWLYLNGYWVWTPYSRHYRSRSYWRPAIVYLTYVNNSYCWYPLPYDYAYYDYNREHRRRWRRNRSNPRNERTGRRETRRETPPENIERARRNRTPPLARIPRSGVVSIPAGEFGVGRRGTRVPPLSVADRVLRKTPVVNESPPLIPSFEEKKRRIGKEILIPAGQGTTVKREVRTGAAERKGKVALDKELRRKTIYGDRIPRPTVGTSGNGTPVATPTRRTGVFERKRPAPEPETERTRTTRRPITPRPTSPPVTKRPEQPDAPATRNRPTRRTPPVYQPPARRTPERKQPEQTPPVYQPPPRREPPARRPSPPVNRQPRKSPPPPAQPRAEPKRESPPPARREKSPPLSRSKSKAKEPEL